MNLGRAINRQAPVTHRRGVGHRFFIATPADLVALDQLPAGERSAGLESLIEQELHGRRAESVPPRVADLCRRFGFEWEPIAELGHMRFVGPGAFMFSRAREVAAEAAREAVRALRIPLVEIEGVNLLDESTTLMRRYAELLANEPGLYGSRPYEVAGEDARRLVLRQTGCLQKLAVCRDRHLSEGGLPLALFEISDSYRQEPAETLQLGARLRRFHLPEAHLHTAGLEEAVGLSLELAGSFAREASRLTDDLQLFVSASHRFASRRPDYFMRLAAILGRPVLVKRYPAGAICQDGVEVDVEYKVIDALGCAREFSTFQLDERITRVFGLGGPGRPLATIHAVFTSSVERYLYFQLDRVAASEARGVRATLPLELSPVVVRLIPSESAALQRALELAPVFEGAGIRVDVDDRPIEVARKLADADAELVPYQILLAAADDQDRRVAVRACRTGAIERRPLSELGTELVREERRPRFRQSSGFRLSRRPLEPT